MITVRIASQRDRGTVRRIECACFGYERFLFGLWPRTGRADSTTWIAESDGMPTGYVIAYDRHLNGMPIMYVGGVGVLPKNRKQGVASQLMKAVLAQHPRLWLHVRASNIAATALYLKLGMRIGQRIQQFYSNGDTALVMQSATITEE